VLGVHRVPAVGVDQGQRDADAFEEIGHPQGERRIGLP
jgi:hypothetical protein